MESPAQIAARYGAVAPVDMAVTVVPTGASARPLPVWDGLRLVYAEGVGREMFRRGNATARRQAMANSPAVQAARARRDRVAALHATGASDAEMAAALGVAVNTITGDRAVLGLGVNSVIESRRAGQLRTLREMVSSGHDDEAVAAAIGLSLRRVRRLARAEGVMLRLRSQARRKKPGPKPDRPKLAAPARPCLTAEEKAARRRAYNRARYAEKKAAQPPRERHVLTPEERIERRRALDRRLYARKRGAAVKSGPTPTEQAAARREAVRAAHARGLSVADTAVELGETVEAVRRDRRKLGLGPVAGDLAANPMRYSGSPVSDVHSPARLEDLRDRVAAGESLRSVAIAWGWPWRSVGRLAARFDIQAQRVRAPSPRLIERRQQVAQLRQAGVTLREIAKACGVSATTVSEDISALQLARADGIRPPYEVERAQAVAARRARVAQMRAAGLTLVQMMAETGASATTISSDITALGLGGTSLNGPSGRSFAVTHPDKVRAAVRLALDGLTEAQIAARLCVRRDAVRRMIRAAQKAQTEIPLSPEV
jgi:DNA-binding NarL/FixJ family response regulator